MQVLNDTYTSSTWFHRSCGWQYWPFTSPTPNQFPNPWQQLHPKLRNINPHNVTHSLISWNPREQMFVVHISLLIVTFLSLISRIFVINANHQRSQPTPSHCDMCQYVECHLLIFILLLLMSLVKCWSMDMSHCSGRPSGVDHSTTSKCCTLCYSIVSHATLILLYHAFMWTLQNFVISRALWMPEVWYYKV